MNDTKMRSVGRPKIMTPRERVARIAEAAEEVFLEFGFTDTKMTVIAHRAGMSKRTLYENFANKEAIFARVVRFQKDVPTFPPIAPDENPRQALHAILVRIVEFILDPHRVALARLAIGESHNFPEIALDYFENGYDVLVHSVASHLELLIERGQMVRVENPRTVADLLLSATLGDSFIRRFGLADKTAPSNKDDIARRADYALSMMALGLSVGPQVN